MSNDRHEDKRVSDTYKTLANERTPEYLDNKVLAMAASATSKPGYSRWMAWSRPVAWAATITLCLAITLELAQDPAMTVSVESNSPASMPEMEEFKRDNDVVSDRDIAERQDLIEERKLADDGNLSKDKELAKEERGSVLRMEDLELQQEVAESIAETAASEKTSLARSASKQAFSEPAPVAAAPAAELSDTAVSLRAAPATDDAVPAAARARSEEAQVASGAAIAGYTEADDSSCPAEVRAVASDWLDCILELEAAGLDAAAAAERELLIDTFPDFKLP